MLSRRETRQTVQRVIGIWKSEIDVTSSALHIEMTNLLRWLVDQASCMVLRCIQNILLKRFPVE